MISAQGSSAHWGNAVATDFQALDRNVKWGAYVLMIVCVIQPVFAFLRLRAAGESLPWEGDSRSGD
jgi:hypothetical protein